MIRKVKFSTMLLVGLVCLELTSLLAEHLFWNVGDSDTAEKEGWICLWGCHSRGESSQSQMEALGRQISIRKLFLQSGLLSKGLSCLSNRLAS